MENGIYIFDDPEEFLKMIARIQDEYPDEEEN